VLAPVLHGWAQPGELARHGDVFEELGRAYKQLNAPVGALSLASLRISTRSLGSGDATFDGTFAALTHYLSSLTSRRDGLAARIEQVLDDAAFGHRAADPRSLAHLTAAAHALIEAARLVADFVDLV
jgi:hypothetical protein